MLEGEEVPVQCQGDTWYTVLCLMKGELRSSKPVEFPGMSSANDQACHSCCEEGGRLNLMK
jgi:hypothetical protein